MIQRVHQAGLDSLIRLECIKMPRQCGTIAAFNLKMTGQYGSTDSIKLRAAFQKKGLLIRPLGNVIYLMPPYCINETDLKKTYSIIAEELQGAAVCQD
jgi:adenosylmethionine-8-amino-7-oxononanoate aminotransferase